MKNLIIIIVALIFVIGCNNSTTTKETPVTATDTTEKLDYAYLPSNHQPDNWDRGDQKNVVMVLKSLKGFETKNIEQALAPFADTVRWTFDGMDDRISKDSLRAMFIDDWKTMKDIKIVMDDYEAVISKDKKTQYVTLWYKQIITDNKDKVDSVACVDDLRIENGKITELDEKTRKYPKD